MVGVGALVGCNKEPPTAPAVDTKNQQAWVTLGQIRPAEAHFHELAQRIPGFGGYFLDASGTLVGYVTDTTQRGRLQAELLSVIAARQRAGLGPRSSAGNVEVRRGQFDFPSLARWRDIATANLLTISGIVSTDADEAANRVTIGVNTHQFPHAKQAAIDVLKSFDVPPAAVRFVDVKESIPLVETRASPKLATRMFNMTNTSLLDEPDPLMAGYRAIMGLAPPNAFAACTFSPVVEWNGILSVITNSHCSPTTYGVDNGFPIRTVVREVGSTETIDPTAPMCGVFPCRYSDAALFTLTPGTGISFRRGAIAITTNVAYGWGQVGSLDVANNGDFYAITSVVPSGSVLVGDAVLKTGERTGTTGGHVLTTCEDHSDQGYIRLCGFDTDAFADHGDSGSPMYTTSSGGALLYGILWGSGSDWLGNNWTMISYWTFVQSELGGNIVATTDITLSSSTISGSISGVYPVLSFTAAAATNSPSSTAYWLRRRTWSAASQSYSEIDANILFTDSPTSYTDFDRTTNQYYGSQRPPDSVDFLEYYVLATNHGVSSVSNVIYFKQGNQS